jgi:hypothetical protein
MAAIRNSNTKPELLSEKSFTAEVCDIVSRINYFRVNRI